MDLLRRSLAFAVILFPALAPGQDWNERTVLRMLMDSAWTRTTKVKLVWEKQGRESVDYREIPGNDRSTGRPIGGPVPGIGVPRLKLPVEADLLVRWASALPVREATAQYKRKNGKPDAQVEEAGPDYVLEIRGIPSSVAHMGAGSIETLAVQSSTLRTGRGRTIKASGAHVTLEGDTLTVRIHFPRTGPIQPGDRDVEVAANFQIFDVHARFRLREMVYQGNLEL